MTTLTINLAGTPTPVQMPGGVAAAAATTSAAKAQAWAEGTLPGGVGTKSAKEHAQDAADESALAQDWAEGTLPGGTGTKSAKEHAEDAATSASDADAYRAAAEAANASAALNKTGAETAQAAAQDVADDVAVNAGLAQTAKTDAETARDTVLAFIGPLDEVVLANLLQGDGSLRVGTGAFVPTGSGGLGTAVGTDAGAGMGVDAQKASLLGGGAGNNAKGYAIASIGVFSHKNAWAEYGAAAGTHAFQNFNRNGIEVRGFGTPASGTLTFTGAGTAGQGFTIGGVTFTAVASAPGANQYLIGATAADTAKNAHRAIIDARATNVILQEVLVRRLGAVLTVASLAYGTLGNSFTLATDDAAIALSGATLTGGAAGINNAGVTGPIAMGFGAGQDAQPVKARPGWNIVTFSGQPTAGETFRIGATPVTFTWVAGAPVGANEVGIYGDLASTMFELAERLATHANASVGQAWYYPLPNGLYIIFKTNGGGLHTVDFRNTSVATAAFGRLLRGGSSEYGRDISLIGFNSGSGAKVSRAAINGSGNGVGSAMLRVSINGSNSGGYSYLENTYFFGQDNGGNVNAFGCAAFGNNNFIGSTNTPYIALTAIASDGTLTLAQPHGFIPGRTYSMEQRNLVDANDRIKRSVAGTGTPTNIATGVNAFQCEVVGPRTLRIYQFKNDDAAQDTFSVSGTVGNIEVRSISNTWSSATVIGNFVTAKNNAVTVCGADQPRFHSDASEGNFLAAPLLLNSYTFTTAHRMQCAFSANPANGETITIFGQTFTFRTTATLITEIQIGANALATVQNIVERVCGLSANPTYQAVFSRIIPYPIAALSPAANFGIVLCDTGTDMTMTTTSAVGTVTTLAALAVGNIPAANSFPSDMDGCIFRTTNNPRRGGQPGLARLNRTAGRVEFLP